MTIELPRTDRLNFRELMTSDAPFILELVNGEPFRRFIGDRGVRDLDGAVGYIRRAMDSYVNLGFGLWRVSLRDSDEPVGICGLVKRESLPDVDMGYAFLPEHWSKGYAAEAARAVVEWTRDVLGVTRLLAITNQDNDSSIRVLEKAGMKFERTIQVNVDEAPVKLFSIDL